MGRTLFVCSYVGCNSRPSKRHNVQRHVWMCHVRKTLNLDQILSINPNAPSSLTQADVLTLDYQPEYKPYVTGYVQEFNDEDDSNISGTKNTVMNGNVPRKRHSISEGGNHVQYHNIMKPTQMECDEDLLMREKNKTITHFLNHNSSKNNHHNSNGHLPNNNQNNNNSNEVSGDCLRVSPEIPTSPNNFSHRRRGSLSPGIFRKTQLVNTVENMTNSNNNVENNDHDNNDNNNINNNNNNNHVNNHNSNNANNNNTGPHIINNHLSHSSFVRTNTTPIRRRSEPAASLTPNILAYISEHAAQANNDSNFNNNNLRTLQSFSNELLAKNNDECKETEEEQSSNNNEGSKFEYTGYSMKKYSKYSNYKNSNSNSNDNNYDLVRNNVPSDIPTTTTPTTTTTSSNSLRAGFNTKSRRHSYDNINNSLYPYNKETTYNPNPYSPSNNANIFKKELNAYAHSNNRPQEPISNSHEYQNSNNRQEPITNNTEYQNNTHLTNADYNNNNTNNYDYNYNNQYRNRPINEHNNCDNPNVEYSSHNHNNTEYSSNSRYIDDGKERTAQRIPPPSSPQSQYAPSPDCLSPGSEMSQAWLFHSNFQANVKLKVNDVAMDENYNSRDNDIWRPWMLTNTK
eukprot:Pgem_evm1s18553